MIKKFSEYIKESFEMKIKNYDSEDDESYARDFLNAFNEHLPIKKASGENHNFEAHFEITLTNDYHFAIAIFWDESGEEEAGVHLMLPNRPDGDGVDFNGRKLEEIGYSMVTHTEEVMKELKEVLRKEGAFKNPLPQYSAVLNIEGYGDFVQTFNSEEEANKFIKRWKDSWEVVKGTQLQGKRMGVTEEGDES